MSKDQEDVVRVATGSAAEVGAWAAILRGAGIDCRVVGGHLTAGLGTAVPGSVELWVRRAAAKDAEVALGHHGRHHATGSHRQPPYGHPVSDPKPDRSRGPTHGAPPHRPLPS